jgi:hypothetical protein
MSARKTTIGIVLVGALAFSVLVAASASAAPTGYTAFTCKKVESGGTFTKAHCRKADAGSGAYAHVGFAEKTSITFTNAGTATETTTAQPAFLKSTILGVKLGISCTTVSGTGTIENGKEGEEMFVGIAGIITYSGCTVTEPAGKGCVVKGGSLTTKELSATTKGKGMNLEFIPKSGTTFVEITIEGCSVSALNGTFAVSGSLTVPEIEASGATLSTTEAQVTEAGTLKWGGNKAGLEGSVTVKGPSGAGISMTTVTTPPPPSGYTTFTCKKVASGGAFSKAHCRKADASAGGAYGHVGFSEQTSITSTNANTAAETTASSSAFLKATISGLSTRIGCTTISGTGTLENGVSGEEMFTNGTGTIKYSECIVYEPAEKGCVVKGGSITTKELSATTKGQGMNIKFTPKEGTTFTEITLEGCSVTALNNTYPVTGSVTVPEIEASGSTLSTTEAAVTEANTLQLGGQKAGLETSMTLKGPSGDGLSATTYPYTEPPKATGYTAFTCKKVESGGTFTRAHCKKADAGAGSYKHVGFGEKTSITGTNSNSAAETSAASSAFLKGTIGGVKVGLGCNTVSATGTVENGKEGEEMFVSGTGTISYSGCIVFEPAEKNCVVAGGTIKTKELSATTKGQGMNVKFSPKEGTTFAETTIEGCTGEAVPKGTYTVTGSLTVPEIEGSGSTLTTTESEVTSSGTLKFAGNAAGLETSVTLKGPSGDGLSATTPPYTE